MHPSSLENMQRLYDAYVMQNSFAHGETVCVLDVGGADVNGSYRTIFSDSRFCYLAVDLQPGPGVDLVLDDPCRIPLPDGAADIVLSGQMLEHCEFFWDAFREMVRVLDPNGYLFLIAPSAGPEHRYPVDCYRFLPDSYRALAKYAGCRLIEVWRDDRGPWQDLVGVFKRYARFPVQGPIPTYSLFRPAVPLPPPPVNAQTSGPEECLAGAVPYLRILEMLHRILGPRVYLEIGVRNGDSLSLATCRAVGVDPTPALSKELPHTTSVVPTSSDVFFATATTVTLGGVIELAFIDGMHLFEFALRDFMNIERLAHPGAVLLIDDVFPNHPLQGQRNRLTRAWAGDIWQLTRVLAAERPDLLLVGLDTYPTGMLLVAGLDCTNTQLRDRYNPIVAGVWAQGDPQPPEAILKRSGAIHPDSPDLMEMMCWLAGARNAGSKPNEIRAGLRRWTTSLGLVTHI